MGANKDKGVANKTMWVTTAAHSKRVKVIGVIDLPCMPWGYSLKPSRHGYYMGNIDSEKSINANGDACGNPIYKTPTSWVTNNTARCGPNGSDINRKVSNEVIYINCCYSSMYKSGFVEGDRGIAL